MLTDDHLRKAYDSGQDVDGEQFKKQEQARATREAQQEAAKEKQFEKARGKAGRRKKEEL